MTASSKEYLNDFISRNRKILERYDIALSKKVDIESGYGDNNELFVYCDLSSFRTKYHKNAWMELWCDIAAKDAKPRLAMSVYFNSSIVPDDIINAVNLMTVSYEDEWEASWPVESKSRPTYTIDKDFYGKLILEYTLSKGSKKGICVKDRAFEPSIELKKTISFEGQEHGATSFLTCYFEKEDFEDVLKLYLTKIVPSLQPKSNTSSLQLVQARIGQGKYRSDLIDKWGGCAVTGCENLNFLVASHILPWATANNEERLDPNNGLLLSAVLDKAFDRFLMTFKNDGTPIFSKALSEEDRKCLHLDENSKIADEEKLKPCIKYLEKHRAIFEEKEADR